MSNNVLFDVPGPKARRTSRIASIVSTLVIAGALVWLYLTLAAPRVTANGTETPGMFDPIRWDILSDGRMWNALIVRGLLEGTLRMAAVAAILAIVVGVLFSFARTARSKWIRLPAAVLLDFFRGMPVLLLMLFTLLVFGTGAYWAGVSALAVYNGAIIGEALRCRRASANRVWPSDSLRCRHASSLSSRRHSARCCPSSSPSWWFC
jgi:glutamate transport system permease protein